MGLAFEILGSILLFFLVFGMSATVELHAVKKQLRNRSALAIGLALQFFILPLCGFLVVKIFQLPAVVGITLLVVTSSPGGSYSNWWCSLFNAELALSVTMTAISTLLSTVMLPANLMLYTTWAYGADVVSTSLDFSALFLSICVVLGGITAGLIGGHFSKRRDSSERFHRRANLFGNLAGICLITLSITVSSTNHKAALWDQSWNFYVGVATPAVLGLCMATFMGTRCDLHKPERVAVAVEACYQNTGIATSVALNMFSGNESDLATAIGVPLYYGMVVAIMLAVFCLCCWKAGWTKAPKDENFCVMISNSYEVEPSTVHEAEISIEVVYGEEQIVSNTANGELIFEQTDDGAYIIDETSLHKAKKRQEQKQRQRAHSNSDEITLEGSDLSGGGDNGGGAVMTTLDEEQASNGGADTNGGLSNNEDTDLGRFGRTIAVIKARATGYRQPHHNLNPRTTADHDDSYSSSQEESSDPTRIIRVSTRGDENVDNNDFHGDPQVIEEAPSYPVGAIGDDDNDTPSSSPPSAADADDRVAVLPSKAKLKKKRYQAVPLSTSPDKQSLPEGEQVQQDGADLHVPSLGKTID